MFLRIIYAVLAAWLALLTWGCFVDPMMWAVVIGPLFGLAVLVALALAWQPDLRGFPLLLVILSSAAVAGMWMHMSTESISDSTGPVLLFTVPVLVLLYLSADLKSLTPRSLLPTLGPLFVMLLVWIPVHLTIDPRNDTNMYRSFGLNLDYRVAPESWRYQLRILASVLVVIAVAWGSIRRIQGVDRDSNRFVANG